MKKETIEEFAERFVNSTRLKNPKSLIIEGAKWQQEQDLLIHENIKTDNVFESLRKVYEHQLSLRYSEEEVLDLIKARQISLMVGISEIETQKWFEQFKKE